MTIPLLVFSVLTLVVLLALCVPLWRQRAAAQDHRADYDLRVYRDQLAEIERDGRRGVLSDSEAEAARLEVQRRVLAVDAESQRAVRPSPRSTRFYRSLAVAVGVVVVTGTAGVYGLLGHPSQPDAPWLPLAAQRLGLSPEALKGQMAVADRAGRLPTTPPPINPVGWPSPRRAVAVGNGTRRRRLTSGRLRWGGSAAGYGSILAWL